MTARRPLARPLLAVACLAMAAPMTACGSDAPAAAPAASSTVPSSEPLESLAPMPPRTPDPIPTRTHAPKPPASPQVTGGTAVRPANPVDTEPNPLAAKPWGVYKGDAELAWPPYAKATGETKRLLGKIALRPKAKWFGAWIPNSDIGAKVHEYIKNAQAGDPDALVQMTVFRMTPWEQDACHRLPTAAEQASYKDWTDRFAAAVGSTRTVIVLQPDGPFALCAPDDSLVPSHLIRYSARVFSALPNTTVYIEAGAADWPSAGQGGVTAAADILEPAGIQYVRGFALNGTHYSTTDDEVARGAAIVEELAKRGLGDKHFVVNTSSNGKGFEFGTYDGRDPDNARVCATPDDTWICVTLGIPPTADVANPKWGLNPATNRLAAKYADAYLWFGRPWLYRQNSPFVMARALGLARTTPY